MKNIINQRTNQNKIGLQCANMPLSYINNQKFIKDGKKNLPKMLCSIFLVANTAFAFDYKDLNATILSSNFLQSDSGVKIEQIIITKDNIKQPLYLIADRFLATNIIDTKEKIDFNAQFTQKNIWQSFVPSLNLIPSDYIASFNETNRNSQYLFLDPLCPYCQEFIQNLTIDKISDTNLNIVFTPLYSHGDLAMVKSALIVSELKNAKDDTQKLEILKKFFTDQPEISVANTEIYDNIDKYRAELFTKKIVTQTPSVIVKPKE